MTSDHQINILEILIIDLHPNLFYGAFIYL